MRSSVETHDELSAMAAAVVVLAFVVGALGGFAAGGLFGAFMGALGSAGVTAAVLVVRRLGNQTRRLEEAPPIDVRGLPPTQALFVMSAAGGRGAPFASELLTRLETIEARAEHDAEGALEELDQLVKTQPQSPAIWACRAKISERLGRTKDAARAASRAITWGLDKGMNPMAARTFDELREIRDHLELDGVHWERLARALNALGRADDASWCRLRAG